MDSLPSPARPGAQVQTLDRVVAVLEAVAVAGPCSLAELVRDTGLARPTAYRLAVACEGHGLLARDDDGRFRLGGRLVGWGARARARVRARGGGRPGARGARRRDRRERAALRARGRHARLHRDSRAGERPARHRSPRCGDAARRRDRAARRCSPGRPTAADFDGARAASSTRCARPGSPRASASGRPASRA